MVGSRAWKAYSMRIKPWKPAAALLLASLVCACASDPTPPPGGGPGGPGRRGGRPPGQGGGGGPGAAPAGPRLFFSPAGEPFRPTPGGPDPMQQWFDIADANHDGALSPQEFLADHMRFFAQLDANSDGYIDSFEVTAYEERVAPEILGFNDRPDVRVTPGVREAPPPTAAGPVFNPDGLCFLPPRNNTSEPRGADYDGAARYGLINEPEPVRAADADYDFRVSKAEWQAASARRFALLDRNHDG
jgi:hypothetical protein